MIAMVGYKKMLQNEISKLDILPFLQLNMLKVDFSFILFSFYNNFLFLI